MLAGLLFFLVSAGSVFAKDVNKLPYSDYVKKYNRLAVEHMRNHKIPASITLAQGILETGGGRSEFVKETNNHFGIKCHADWEGGRFYKADDSPNDCFRTYKNAEDSFDDHSRFLKRARYAKLFQLDTNNYKGWAKGLLECGYATDRAYADKLIRIIEEYELYTYDKITGEPLPEKPVPNYRRVPYKANGVVYVIGEENDSYEKIAGDIGYKAKELRKYNEVPEGTPVSPGDIIYLGKKKKKATKPYSQHTVRVGDSMHSISQLYGVQMESLYKLNKKSYNYVPSVGERLRLQ